MKEKFILSAAFGIPFGGAMYIVYSLMGINIGFPLVLFAAASASILFFLFFAIYKNILNKRYAKIETEIPFPIFYKTNGNFDLGSGRIKNGNIYFCDAGIVCVCMEEKPYTMDEILVQDISKIAFDSIHLHICTKDNRLFKITTSDASKVIELLKEKDWVE